MHGEIDHVITANRIAEGLPLGGVEEQMYRGVVLDEYRNHAGWIQDCRKIIYRGVLDEDVALDVVLVIRDELAIESRGIDDEQRAKKTRQRQEFQNRRVA